jgi:hypothetical protein
MNKQRKHHPHIYVIVVIIEKIQRSLRTSIFFGILNLRKLSRWENNTMKANVYQIVFGMLWISIRENNIHYKYVIVCKKKITRAYGSRISSKHEGPKKLHI